MHVFFGGALLLGGDVITTELWGDRFICRSVNQRLMSFWNRELHGIGFAVMAGDLTPRATKKIDHGILAQGKVISPAPINNTPPRQPRPYPPPKGCQAQPKMAP